MKITLVEERQEDSWFDLSLRKLRAGKVRFYKVDDPVTGKWLFKICLDDEFDKAMVKALKCPAGKLLSQLEGATMVFQKSIVEGLYYDIISLVYADSEGRLRRQVAKTLEDIPEALRASFDVKSYEEATGKKILKSHFVTLCAKESEKEMIALFVMQRAWTLPREERPKEEVKEISENQVSQQAKDAFNLLSLIKKLQKTSITDVQHAAHEKLGADIAVVNDLLTELEVNGKIERAEDGFIKIRTGRSRGKGRLIQTAPAAPLPVETIL